MVPKVAETTPAVVLTRVLHSRGGGGKQVNKALYTCTSWHAYAAMFSSSMAFQCGS